MIGLLPFSYCAQQPLKGLVGTQNCSSGDKTLGVNLNGVA